MKKILTYLLYFVLWLSLVYAADNYFRSWDNWDANVATYESPNDIWTFSGRLDLEDSRSSAYINNWYRWKLTWWIESNLFWTFINESDLILKLKWKYSDPSYTNEIKTKCLDWNSWTSWPEPEIYTISGSIISNWNLSPWGTGEDLWWTFYTSWALSDSYFCSNKKMFLHLFSETIWNKKAWSWNVSDNDVFWKQEIYIHWIANVNWDSKQWILSRWDQEINAISIYIWNKAKIKWDINKNIAKIYKTYLWTSWNKASWDTIENFINNSWKEYFYIYDYKNNTENITFSWSTYINKWKKLIIDESVSDNITDVKWINTVLVNWWNIYIKSDIKNNNDNTDLLILIATRDKTTKNWGNIYINPNVTNIDAVLIADGSLISLSWTAWNEFIQSVTDTNQKNNLRKQLLIYWKIYSKNNIWTDKMPFGSDLYENSSYTNNQMDWNIYDLWNLRTFNLNYGDSWKNCTDVNKLAPIDWNWDYLLNAWAWRKNCYLNDNIQNWLRWSDKLNPLIIENNLHIDFLDPFVLRKN
jgi:hypothetical protein